MRPTLLNGCASAATAAEARFRIDRPIPGRSARVIALDEGAAAVVRRIGEKPWRDARFLVCEDRIPDADIVLRATDGSAAALSEQLAGADVAILIATSGDGFGAAAEIARACDRRGVMTAGLVLGERLEVEAAVSALRPYAPVLLVSEDEGDLPELLTALRA